MVLSNLTHTLDLDTRTITTMGDTLGRIEAETTKGFYSSQQQTRCLTICLSVSFCAGAASKGLIDAAHFCYLMAQVGLGVYTKKSTKMVLIGSNHR